MKHNISANSRKPLIIVVLLSLILIPCFSLRAQTAVWQWAANIKNSRENNGKAKAYLWIAPNCKKVKAFIFSQHNMEEQYILENQAFRSQMGKLGIAEVWVSPAFDHLFNFKQGAGATFTSLINELANISGYTELSYAPFIGMGHSAAASAPYYMAAWNPQRALAAISVSGQWPYFRSATFAPDIWENRNIDYIPCLETMGEYEAANTVSAEGLKEREMHPLIPLSMLANPGQGHFASTDEKCKYLGLYIKKVLQYRLPKHPPNGIAPSLKPINPTQTGWLVDRWRFDQLPTAAPAPVRRYKGDPSQAFWFFDEELAKATVAYQGKHRNQKPQLIGFMEDRQMVPQQNTHQQINLKFQPEPDGITFKLQAAFYDTVPGGSPRPAAWVQKPVGPPLGHAAQSQSIRIERITGPVIRLDDSIFRINPQRGFWESPRGYELWFAATHQGDKQYKPAVQQSQMIVPVRNEQGKKQQITFPAIPNQRQGKLKLKLKANSDAGVPVYFYVEQGPAMINGNVLTFTAMPPRSKYPIQVIAVAWQYGTSRQPQLQTAESVTQSFWINK